MSKNKIGFIILAILILLLGLVYIFTPQEKWVPTYIKLVVNSCYKEGESIPVISSDPQCCLGLKKGSNSDEALYMVGANICIK